MSDVRDSSSPAPACRLFVYLARRAPVGVVLRRGPSDWARLSLWHTDTDSIEHGQWLKGRVYERRCDVSADGRLFAAFIRKSGGGSPLRSGPDSWVALSRPPYFTALAVWFVGGTYHTGACFPADDTLWLGFSDQTTPDIGAVPPGLSIAAPGMLPYIERSAEWTERTVHFNRLLRDGWTMTGSSPAITAWHKRHPSEPRALTMTQLFEGFNRPGGPYVVDYDVVSDAGGTTTVGQASWADWDHRGRLVMTRDGRLGAWVDGTGFQLIEDFNPHVPDPQPAPPGAAAGP